MRFRIGQHCLAIAWVVAMFVAIPTPARAAVILVTTEAGITNDGLLDWGVLDPGGAVSNPFTTPVPGIAGLDMTVSQGGGDFQPMEQSFNWFGNFAPGEELLYTGTVFGGGVGPMTFVFDTPIAGFGAQIQAFFFGAFAAEISAFDAANNLLGTFQVPGVSNGNADDSAIFIGVLSSMQDITRIVLGVPIEVVRPEDFAINSPRIQGYAQQIPEPTSLMLFGLAGLRTVLRRRLSRL